MDLLKSINHPDEITALFKYKISGTPATIPKLNYTDMSNNSRACYDMLNKTSRSFAAVIQALDEELRHAVCVFYLVLRALDTVEDDMTIPMETKVPLLKKFHTFLYDEKWCYRFSEEKDKEVLERFPVISSEFRSLKAAYREVISDICKKMGEGMTVYLDRAPNTIQDWNEYCHYVAGLVGIGLSRLFSASGLENPVVGEDAVLSNSMGLFLQKTNIIRDYLEDVLEDRDFWPKEVWGKYGEKQKDLYMPQKREEALACLNELVTNAMKHIPDCIKYMSRLKNQSVFNFCAIPQVMAIATLERCYNNYDVFKRVVKIRKGETVRMMMEATNVNSVKAIMSHFVKKIQLRIPQNDPTSYLTRELAEQAIQTCNTNVEFVSSHQFYPIYVSFAMLSSAILWTYWTGISHYFEDIFE